MEEPSNTSVPRLASTKLKCVLSDQTFSSKIVWFRNEQPLTYDRRIRVSSDRSTLYLSGVIEQDVGNYQCKVRDRNGLDRLVSRVARLSLVWKRQKPVITHR